MGLAHFRSGGGVVANSQHHTAENSFKGDPNAGLAVRYRLPVSIPTNNPMIALNQFRGGYPHFLGVLHEEEESSVPSPSNVQLVENQQQLEQLNLQNNNHCNRNNSPYDNMGGGFRRCVPPSIIITGVGRSNGGATEGGGNVVGGAIALR